MNVGVIDIGSPKKGNIGWAVDGTMTKTGNDLDEGIRVFADALKDAPLALGFEAPMFVPMRDKAVCLTKGRNGEGNKAFSAGAGATVLVTSTVVVPYVLRGLRKAVPDAVATMKWQGWPHDGTMSRQLLLFEAFVSGRQPHIDAAKSAAQELNKRLKTGNPIKSDVAVGDVDEDESFNILGAMMMRTGWAKGTDVLEQPCLVVKPSPQKETLGS